MRLFQTHVFCTEVNGCVLQEHDAV